MSRQARQRLKIWAISWVGWALIWIIGLTLRFRVEDEETLRELRAVGRPIVFCFWHNQMILAAYHFRFQEIMVMASRHFDGEYIGRIVERFGYRTARGSSTRGALRALLEMKRHLEAGRDAAFTADGPRGPRYRVKPGPVFLAQHSGCPILCFYFVSRKHWQLKSWDRLRIPKPFTEATLQFGRPIWVAREAEEGEELDRVQAEMDRLQVKAERRYRPGWPSAG